MILADELRVELAALREDLAYSENARHDRVRG